MINLKIISHKIYEKRETISQRLLEDWKVIGLKNN